MKQYTLKKKYKFVGKGLHSGRIAHLTVGPAPVDTGIRFYRKDMGHGAFVDAIAENVTKTARSTTISCGQVKVMTIEHLLSALTGLGIDNALVEIDNLEVPILDGSARPYIEAIGGDELVEQDAERKYITIEKEMEFRNPKTGSYIKLIPAEEPSYTVTIDFNSRVLGVQTVKWDASVNYAKEIAPCRTFCFFHEIMPMLAMGLVKGGDVENAIVIVEKPAPKWMIKKVARICRQPLLEVTEEGYLNNLVMNFPDECGRHKLLDIIGDLRLVGGFLKAEVIAYKPGHGINTLAAKHINSK